METIREEYDDFLQEKERIINRANEYVGNDVQRMMHRLQASAVRDQKCKMHNVYIFGHSFCCLNSIVLLFPPVLRISSSCPIILTRFAISSSRSEM